MKMFIRSNIVAFIIVKSLRFHRFYHKSTAFKYNCIKTKYLFSPLYRFRGDTVHRCSVTSKKTVHTVTAKGWKPLFRDGQKQEHDLNKAPVSCEDGKDAIHHDAVLNQLQNCNTVYDQLNKFCSSVSLTPKDVEQRREFVRSLAELFDPYFPKVKVHLFGSSINGLGFKGCDADVCIQTIFDDKGYVLKVNDIPDLDAVARGEVSRDLVAHLPPPKLLRFVRRILRRHASDMYPQIMLIKARCPLLRFYNAKYDLFCDFSCENYSSTRNTKLMRLICHLDERIAPIIKFIRYWGKYGGFVGDIDLFNSYAFSLLAVHFLQLRNPPVVPPLKELIEKSDYLVHGDVHDDDLLLNDLKKFEKSKNCQTAEELIKEYFSHYLTFDYLKVLIPLNSSIITKDELATMEDVDGLTLSSITVQDPFRLNFNVTEGAKDIACLRFIKGLIEANKMYQDESVWHPSAENWGLSRLFCWIAPYEATNKNEKMKWQQSYTHTVKLPPATDMSVVKTILQECLQFNCEELVMLNAEEGSRPHLRLQCKVNSATWIGRDLIRANCPPSLTDQIEIEKWISAQIPKSKSAGKPGFTFLCECFTSMCDSEQHLILTFNKPEEYVHYLTVEILVTFLKEYIPSMCEQLCKN